MDLQKKIEMLANISFNFLKKYKKIKKIPSKFICLKGN
jgi:hypothetical protein